MSIIFVCPGMKVEENAKLSIDKMAVGYGPSHPPPGGHRRAAICGIDDKENAICYDNSLECTTSKAVARLLINGSSACTGWLASPSNHLVVNEHCITSYADALNTDYEFMAEAPTCNDSSDSWLEHPGNVYSGATFIQDNAALDYVLVKMDTQLPHTVSWALMTELLLLARKSTFLSIRAVQQKSLEFLVAMTCRTENVR